MALSKAQQAEWTDWCTTNLRRGVKPDVLAAQMKTSGLSEAESRIALGPAWQASSSDVDHQAIANCAITRRPGNTPGVKRIGGAGAKAQLFTWENFLSPEDCDRLIALMNKKLRPSTVTDDRGDRYYRTSSTCDLDDVDDAFVTELDRRISAGLGIHWSYAEPNQGQKYEKGQEFKSHTDYFEPGTSEYAPNTEGRGQRTWTFMIYLNNTPEGGATRFPRLEKIFRPKQGMAVVWNNLTPEGAPNPWTLHHGMKPRRGEKYIITKWFREQGWGPMFVEDDGA